MSEYSERVADPGADVARDDQNVDVCRQFGSVSATCIDMQIGQDLDTHSRSPCIARSVYTAMHITGASGCVRSVCEGRA